MPTMANGEVDLFRISSVSEFSLRRIFLFKIAIKIEAFLNPSQEHKLKWSACQLQGIYASIVKFSHWIPAFARMTRGCAIFLFKKDSF